MNEAGVRRFLERRLSPRSLSSYMSNMRRVESALGVSLESCDFSDAGLAGLEGTLRLRAKAFPSSSLADCLTALRTYGEYHNNRGLTFPSARAGVPRTLIQSATPEPPIPEHLQGMSVQDLLVLHSQVGDELRNRKIVRTGNNPIGDYAEHLFAQAFGWTLQLNSASGHDAEKDGVRYQIKSRRMTAKSTSRQLGAIRRLPDKTFDVLAAVLFDSRFNVLKAILIPHDLVLQHAKRVEHTNSWRLMLEDRWWNTPGIQDVTDVIRSAAAASIEVQQASYRSTDDLIGPPNTLLMRLAGLVHRR